MERNDWTPAVLITASVALLTAGFVWLFEPWGSPGDGAPGDTIPRRRLPAEVIVWIGEVGPDLKGVLGPIWGDTGPDRDHDGLLNGSLGLENGKALSYYRLLVFNTSEQARTLELGDGGIVMLGEDGNRVPLRSLAKMRERGEVQINDALEFSLHSLGALARTIEIPPGRAASLMVPFQGETRIETASAIGTTNGTALRRRRMARAAFRRLIEEPDEARVKDL